jgi:hypothetical protein
MQMTTTITTIEIVWGARAIGKAIGRTERATFAALEQGKIPGARKIAGRWGLDFSVFVAAFQAVA